MYWHGAIICKVTLPVSSSLFSNEHKHLLRGRTWMSPALLSNLLLMGPQTISCFHLLYWFDLRPRHGISRVRKKLKIYCLFQVEEAVKEKKKKKESEHAWRGVTWNLKSSVLSALLLYWPTKLLLAAVWLDLMKLSLLLLLPVAPVFQTCWSQALCPPSIISIDRCSPGRTGIA